MKPRLSITDLIDINKVTSGAIVQVGDSECISPRSKVYALQKEYPVFSNEKDGPFYDEGLPEIKSKGNVRMAVQNDVPVIKVGTVNLNGIAASSAFQIGTTHRIDSVSRIKVVRSFGEFHDLHTKVRVPVHFHTLTQTAEKR